MSVNHFMPLNSTPFERAISQSHDRETALHPAIEQIRAIKYHSPLPADFAPWILDEYGLGGIASYFDSADAAIAAGIPWSRLRGTPMALELALGWIGYDEPVLEDQNGRRRKWNRFQVGMGLVPDAELPILMDAEHLANLSRPARAVFFRGWHGYDVRALEWGNGRWGGTIWGDDSGVRLEGGSVKWSHGEDFAGAIVAGPTERQALGVDVELGDVLDWTDIPWNAPGISWDGVTDVAAFKTFLVMRLPVYVGFYDAAGAPIGYRRPVAVRDLTAELPPNGDVITIEVECRTGFGDGEGRAAASCALVFRGRSADVARPGKLWLEPDAIAFDPSVDAEDMTIGAAPVDFLFRKTVRQHVTLTLEI